MDLDAGALLTEATAGDLTVDVHFGAAARRWPVGNGAGASATTTGGLIEGAVQIDLTLNDERRLKKELVAWAKAVASMAIRASVQC
uniref:Uncharacterized protein n=1 Tax=Avena sativa TaxID=4498 RepID=A0ACD5UBL1_AVESA